MTRYDWPDAPDPTFSDDALGRSEHNDRLRVALAPLPPPAPGGGPAVALAPPPAGGAGLVWAPIGPTTVLRGQASGSPRVAGRVRDIAISPDGKRAYAAAAGGGVWYTDDRATTWRPLGDWATTTLAHPERASVRLSCGALHVQFRDDPSNDVVTVGTGELTPRRQGVPGGKLGGVGLLHAVGPADTSRFGEFDDPWTRVASNLEGHGIYRIAQDPFDGTNYVVASSLGLFARAGAHPADEIWNRVAADPFNVADDDTQVISDVLWAPSHLGEPARLYVAWFAKGVWMSENGTSGPFRRVDLPGSVIGRLGLAVAPSDPGTVYVLGAGPRLWRIRQFAGAPKARTVNRVPKNLFGPGLSDQSSYDLAIDVHPLDSDVVILGGSYAYAEDDYNAALVRCKVTETGGELALDWNPVNDEEDENKHHTFGVDPTWIGLGVHADVHACRYVDGDFGLELWVACDGGVYRSRAAGSTQAGDRGTFAALNTGLAVLQPGYTASHPVNDVSMIAGTQDNGVIVRIGVGVWLMWYGGDGGGVAFHPDVPSELVYQYTGASWLGGNGWSKPVMRQTTRALKVRSETEESGASMFYSGIAMTHRDDGKLRMVVGTNRIWLSDGWDPNVVGDAGKAKWVTLPGGNDPRHDNNDNTGDDVQYGDSAGKVVALRWLSNRRLLVLMRRAVLVYRQGAMDKWLVDTISDKGTKCNSNVDNDDITSPSDYLPPVENCEFSDVAVHDPSHGARGSFYVATTGAKDCPNMDTLWWFNGGLKWYRTGLRDEGVPSPAYAVAVDHSAGGNRDVVYVGTGRGVWRGDFTAGDPPDWNWTKLDLGLPEAAVQDLTVERYGDRLLLRAAVQSRGVWELQLSGAASPLTFVRSYGYDGRRAPSSTADTHFPFTFNRPDSAQWFQSPDVAVRPVPGVVPPVPAMPIRSDNAGHRARGLWQFQVALHQVDKSCRPTTQGWTESFGRRLEAYRRSHPVGGNPVPANRLRVIDADVWGQVVVAANAFQPMWDGDEPTEADLLELIRYDTTGDGAALLPPGLANVDVLVHHRASRPLAAGDVRVTVIQTALPADPADWMLVPLAGDACTALIGALTTNTLPPMPAPWSYSDMGSPVRSPRFDVDARHPRPVSFRVDPGAMGDRTLFLAAISTPGEPIAVSTDTVRALVRADHHLAARAVGVG